MELFVESKNAKLFVTVHPKQDAETVILLHGGPGIPMSFSSIGEYLSRKYQVISFDQRGTRRSPANKASYSIEEYIEDINAIARHSQLNQFHLFGHSWGGLYAQIYAEKSPEKILSLFLSSPSSGTGIAWKQTESEVMAFMKEHSNLCGWLKMGINTLYGTLGSDAAYKSLFKQVLENYNKDFEPTFRATDAMVENVRAEPINRTRKAIGRYPQLGSFASCRFRVMIVYGEKDIYGASRQLVKNRFPDAIFVEIENAGHMTWRNNEERFFSVLNSFYKIR